MSYRSKLLVPYFVILVLVAGALQASVSLNAESLKKRDLLEVAAHHNDVETLHGIEVYFTALGDRELENYWAPYYAALAAYRLTALLPNTDDQAKNSLQHAIDHIDFALERSKDNPEILALAGGCYGRMIGFSSMKAMSYGPKAGRLLKRAMELDSQNPRVLIFSAIDLFYKPGFFGGDKALALQRARQAGLSYLSYANTETAQPIWGHAEAFAWTGLIHQDLGELDAAELAFNKGLEIAPEFGWIKHILLPELQQKLESGNQD